MILYENIFIQFISLLYILLIGIVFYCKKKLESAENYIFRNLVIVGIFSAIFDMVSIATAFENPNSAFAIFSAKGYLITLICFALIYTEYAIIITNVSDNETKIKQYKSIRSIIFYLIVIISMAIILAPTYIYVKDAHIMYSYGPATTITYIIGGFCILVWMSLLIVRAKDLPARKIVPIVSVTALGGLATMVQLFNPAILLITAFLVFCITIMYFSVFAYENPDFEIVKELRKAKNDAEKANHAKTDFLSDMSHELRTPLNAIIGFSHSLLEQPLEPEVKEDIEDIASASDTLLELVNEILDISKIESDRFEIVNVEYGVPKVYKYLVTMTQGRIGDKKLQFIHKYSNDIPPVLYGDYVRIKQVAVNLLTNAIKYTQKGYVQLEMDFDKLDEETGILIIRVKDTGMGFKEEDLKKLFTKFKRFDTKKNINVEGTGLGLALTKKLVDLMGGTIHVDSTYGEGTTFEIKIKQNILNKSLEELEETDPSITRENFKGNGQRILIVDDNSVNLKVAKRLLQKYNLKLDFASSGQECMDKVEENNHYDLILLDDQMPEMTGIEVLEKLKKKEDFKTPVIALTANALSGVKEKYILMGFDGYLSKPIDKILLEELLLDFLGKETSKKEEVEELEPVEETTTHEIEPTGNIAYLEENGFDLNKALETLVDMNMYRETAKDILKDYPNKLEKLEEYLYKEDMKNYSAVAHALKGDARYMGMTRLADLAYNQELLSRDNRIEFVKDSYDELVEQTHKDMDVLKKFLGE